MGRSDETIGSFGEWKESDFKYGLGVIFEKVGPFDERLAVNVIDLELPEKSSDPRHWDALPSRFKGKKGYLVDAEFFQQPSYHQQDLFWHHEKRLPDKSSAMTYAKKVMDFADRHTMNQLLAKKKTGTLQMSRLESKIPKLTEVFCLVEANVTTMAQMNKMPIWLANFINEEFRQIASQLAKVVGWKFRELCDQMTAYEKSGQNIGKEAHAAIWNSVVKPFIVGQGGQRVAEFMAKRKTPDADADAKHYVMYRMVGDHSETDFRNILKKHGVLGTNAEKLRKSAVMKFPDGFFWVELSGDDCGIEGDEMQHCGRSLGRMFSLRDSNGKPHVTIDVVDRNSPSWRHALSVIHAEDGHIPKDHSLALQIRGKQNKLPDRKYWQYVKDFMHRQKILNGDSIHLSSEEGQEFDNFVTDGSSPHMANARDTEDFLDQMHNVP